MRERVLSSRDAGFSLVELLVVIVVLGVLSGIAALSVDRFKGDATTSCSAANEKVRASANIAYNNRNGTTGTPTDAELAPYLDDVGDCS